MTLKINYIFILLLIAQTAAAQDSTTYDKNRIQPGNETRITQTGKRGIESSEGIVYYVENDMQTLTAYVNGKVKWKTNIISICGKPQVGLAEIRFLRIDAGKINVTFGKHSSASVDVITGETVFLGSD